MESLPSILLERTLEASPTRVFDVLSRRDKVHFWLGPSDEYRVTAHVWDCRPGGAHRVEFNTPEGETHFVVGEFLEVEAARRLSFTWTWEGREVIDSVVTIVLKPSGKLTHLTLTHTGFPDSDMRDHHRQGWIGTLDRLSRALT